MFWVALQKKPSWNTFCLVLCVRSVSLFELNQKLISLKVSCWWVATFCWIVGGRSNSVWVIDSKCFGWTLQSVIFCSTSVSTKFSKKCQEVFQMPIRDLRSEIFDNCFSLQTMQTKKMHVAIPMIVLGRWYVSNSVSSCMERTLFFPIWWQHQFNIVWSTYMECIWYVHLGFSELWPIRPCRQSQTITGPFRTRRPLSVQRNPAGFRIKKCSQVSFTSPWCDVTVAPSFIPLGSPYLQGRTAGVHSAEGSLVSERLFSHFHTKKRLQFALWDCIECLASMWAQIIRLLGYKGNYWCYIRLRQFNGLHTEHFCNFSISKSATVRSIPLGRRFWLMIYLPLRAWLISEPP